MRTIALLLAQVLDFVLEAPEREFLRYLEDCGDDPGVLAREGREAVARALGRDPVDPRPTGRW